MTPWHIGTDPTPRLSILHERNWRGVGPNEQDALTLALL